MSHGHVLGLIWSGDVELRADENKSPLAMLLDSILSVPTVSLVVKSEMMAPKAYPDSEELVPDCQLGDILFEELGIEVPVNSVVLFEPWAMANADSMSTGELGRQLGKVLSSIAGHQKAAIARSRPRLVASRPATGKTLGGHLSEAEMPEQRGAPA